MDALERTKFSVITKYVLHSLSETDWYTLGQLTGSLETVQDRLRATLSITDSLFEQEELGFFIFVGREVGLLEGGVQPEPSDWKISILRVLRKENQIIIIPNFKN